jgi:hypothetical protein
MFIRRKKNRSGSTSIVVIDKSRGKFREVKTTGTSSDTSELEMLYNEGKRRISTARGERYIFIEHEHGQEEKHVTEYLLGNIENILLNGAQLILNPVFESTGFERIDDEILKHLVISRICQPCSKVATVDCLKFCFDEDVELHKVYRYLDKLHKTQQEKVQAISMAHTKKISGGNTGPVFYDVTTLYFSSSLVKTMQFIARL